jgi:cellulase/cellobiase CelA1
MDRIRKARTLGGFVAMLLLPLAAVAGTFGPSPSPASAQSTASASPTSAPDPNSDAAVTHRAREWIGRFQTGDIDRSQLTSDLSATLDKTAVAQIKSVLPKGPPSAVYIVNKDSASGNNLYIFNVTWPDGTLQFSFGITAGGKIATAYFRN